MQKQIGLELEFETAIIKKSDVEHCVWSCHLINWQGIILTEPKLHKLSEHAYHKKYFYNIPIASSSPWKFIQPYLEKSEDFHVARMRSREHCSERFTFSIRGSSEGNACRPRAASSSAIGNRLHGHFRNRYGHFRDQYEH